MTRYHLLPALVLLLSLSACKKESNSSGAHVIVDGHADYGVAADFEYRRAKNQDDSGNTLQRVGHGSELQME